MEMVNIDLSVEILDQGADHGVVEGTLRLPSGVQLPSKERGTLQLEDGTVCDIIYTEIHASTGTVHFHIAITKAMLDPKSKLPTVLSSEPVVFIAHGATDNSAIEVYVDPGDADEADIQELFDALNDLHRAKGGIGMEFITDGNSVYALEEAEQ